MAAPEDFAAAARRAAREASGEDDGAAQWAAYLGELQKSDPEEYELLVKDMAAFVQQKQAAETIVTRDPTAEDGGLRESRPGQAPAQAQTKPQGEENFAPRMPGGKKKLGETGVTEEDEGIRIAPRPGFVIKTRTDKDEKIFINICVHEAIQKPYPRKMLDENGGEDEGMHVPLSAGPAREDRDNAGKSCLVYDFVVNPEVIKTCSQDKSGEERDFVCKLALGYVEQKFKCAVDYKYKLPRLAYKGDKDAIPAQQIRSRTQPKIQVVDSDQQQDTPTTLLNSKAASAAAAPAPRREKPQQLAYVLKRWTGDPEHASPCKATLTDPAIEPPQPETLEQREGFMFEAILDRAAKSPGLLDRVHVDIGPEVLGVKVDGFYLPLTLFLPMQVDPDTAQASIDDKNFLLRVQVEAALDPAQREAWRTSSGPDVGSRPWLLASAIAVEEAASASGDAAGPQQGPSPAPDAGREADVPKQPEDTDALPEDRFHLSDMLSVHIKEERERERQEKMRRHEEEEARKAEEERKSKEAEKQAKIEALLNQADAELKEGLDAARAEGAGPEVLLENFGVADDDDLLV